MKIPGWSARRQLSLSRDWKEVSNIQWDTQHVAHRRWSVEVSVYSRVRTDKFVDKIPQGQKYGMINLCMYCTPDICENLLACCESDMQSGSLRTRSQPCCNFAIYSDIILLQLRTLCLLSILTYFSYNPNPSSLIDYSQAFFFQTQRYFVTLCTTFQSNKKIRGLSEQSIAPQYSTSLSSKVWKPGQKPWGTFPPNKSPIPLPIQFSWGRGVFGRRVFNSETEPLSFLNWIIV